MAGEALAATRATDGWQPVDLAQTGPVITADIALGKHFGYLDVPPIPSYDLLSEYDVPAEEISQLRVHLSAEDSHRVGDSALEAVHNQGLVTVYARHILTDEQGCQQIRREAGMSPYEGSDAEELNIRVLERLSAAIAHEYSHFGDCATIGDDVIREETRRHDNREARKRAWPEALVAIGGSAVLGYLAQSTESASQAGSSVVANVLTGVTTLASVGLAALWHSGRRKRIGNRFDVYRSRPEESRAHEREAAYSAAMTADNAVAQVITRERISPDLQRKLREIATPTATV